MEKEIKYNDPNEMRIYKVSPKDFSRGAASKFQLRVKPTKYEDEILVFVETSRQTGQDDNGNATFAWKDKEQTICIKLEEVDLGELLTVLNGVKDSLGQKGSLFHQTSKGNSTLSLNRAVKDGVPSGYYFEVSRKINETNAVLRIKHTISLAEAEILRVLFMDAISRKYRWRY